jgi:hypothetical protein
MTQEQIDWILAQDTRTLNRYRDLVAGSGRPSVTRAKWSAEMGNSAWLDVLIGLCEKWGDCLSRANRMDMTFDLVLKDLADLWLVQQGRCSVTGLIMNFESGSVQVRNPYRCSVDRVNNRKGYTSRNIRLLTHWANNAQNTWDDPLFEQFVLATADKIRLRG